MPTQRTVASGVEVRRLSVGRYVVIDHGLDGHPLVGACATNGRVFWGRERADAWADWYCRKHGLRRLVPAG